MSAMQQQDEICLDNEFVGVSPPHNTHIPTVDELLDLCAKEHPRGSIAFPSDSPVFWIKYGQAVYWNEVVAQDMAYHELRRRRSPVRVPAVFYAFKYDYRVFIVMEYILGKTVSEFLDEARSQAEKEHVIDQVALSLTELHRIPIASGVRPAAVDGGYIRHTLFDEREAPRHYENIDQLELHLNEFLKGTKCNHKITDLSLEPGVFCQSDLYPKNFMIDSNGFVVVIDFSDVSILPSSFARYLLQDNMLGFDIRARVWVPSTEGVDNTQALLAVAGRMAIASAFLARLGRRLPGGDKETQDRIANSIKGPLMNVSGRPWGDEYPWSTLV